MQPTMRLRKSPEDNKKDGRSRPFCVHSVFVGYVFCDSVQVRFDVSVQNKLGIREWVVVDEVVQLCPLESIVCHFVLHGSAVDRNTLPSANRSSTQPVSMLNSQLLMFFMIVLLISFQLRFSRSSGLGFWPLDNTIPEMRILKLLEINK